MLLVLYANEKGQVFEHPAVEALGRSGTNWVVPEDNEMIPLPKGASLVTIPGHLPVGMDKSGAASCLSRDPITSRPILAVAALLPQGFTRTLLPATVGSGQENPLPLFGYSAVGFKDGRIWVAAVQSDEHRKWHPVYYNTEGLPARINKKLKMFPDNRIVRQLAHCSLQYSCYTAQNLFYQRWEAGLPTMTACNADCLACISESHAGIDSPQNRLQFQPSVQEIAELGLEHLAKAREGIISFGQGCEGEPALNAAALAPAVRQIRLNTGRGTININTNAGYTEGIKAICDAGLDAMRVTIFSTREGNYNYYHRPRNYRLQDVSESILYAGEMGVQVSLNLLVFPGFTDREDEIESLLDFLQVHPVNMVQLRNLNVDPGLLFSGLPPGGEVWGINSFIKALQQEMPSIKIGSYTHPVRRG